MAQQQSNAGQRPTWVGKPTATRHHLHFHGRFIEVQTVHTTAEDATRRGLSAAAGWSVVPIDAGFVQAVRVVG